MMIWYDDKQSHHRASVKVFRSAIQWKIKTDKRLLN